MKVILYFFVFMFSSMSYAGSSKILYQYRDDQGVSVMSSTLPPEAIQGGYTILNSQGIVQEKIAPQRTESEIAAELRENDRKKAMNAEKTQEMEKNKRLLAMFSSVEDIQNFTQEKIKALEILENITLENIREIKINLKNLNTQKSSEAIKQRIEAENSRLIQHMVFLKEQEAEKQNIKLQGDVLIQRFHSLDQAPVEGSKAVILDTAVAPSGS